MGPEDSARHCYCLCQLGKQWQPPTAQQSEPLQVTACHPFVPILLKTADKQKETPSNTRDH